MKKKKAEPMPFSAAALSVATAALAEQLSSAQPQALWQGAAAALMLGILAGWLGSIQDSFGRSVLCKVVLAVLLAVEFVQTAAKAQEVCRQEFSSMALIGLLPLLLLAGWKLPFSSWEAPARVLWWIVALGGAVFLLGVLGQMHWERLLEFPDTANAWVSPVYAEYFLFPMLCQEKDSGGTFCLPIGVFGLRAAATICFALVFGAGSYPARELLRAWSMGAFSRVDTFLLLVWFGCALFRLCFLTALLRRVLQPETVSPQNKGAME